MAKAGEEDLRQMALAVPVVHQTRAVVEVVVHRIRVAGVAAAEEDLPKQLEHSVLVSVSLAVEVAVGWRMDGVVPAKEAVEADQRLGVVHLDFWGEGEGVRPHSAVWHARDRSLEYYAGKTVREFESAVVEEPQTTFSLLEKVVGRQTLALHPLRLP